MVGKAAALNSRTAAASAGVSERVVQVGTVVPFSVLGGGVLAAVDVVALRGAR